MGDESDDDLPLNWEVKQTDDGQLFYVNHQIQATQWEHPITKQITFVSKGKYRCSFVFSIKNDYVLSPLFLYAKNFPSVGNKPLMNMAKPFT